MFVLLVAGVKAVYEDFKRHAEDKETNNSVTHVMQPDGERFGTCFVYPLMVPLPVFRAACMRTSKRHAEDKEAKGFMMHVMQPDSELFELLGINNWQLT